MKDRLLADRPIAGLLLAVVLLVYGNILANQFTMDDGLYIELNQQVTHPSLRQLFSPNAFSNVFRPVTFATLALNWALGRGQPAGYHLLNLLLHAVVAWLLYLLLREILGPTQNGKIVAFLSALLFAVHPIHTEAVASAVGRAELLAAGFLLAAWILHLRDHPIASLICFVLALLSKESAVAFFPLVFIGDYLIARWKPRTRYAQIAGVTLLYLGVLWKVQGNRFGQQSISMLDNPLASLSAGWRILNAFRVAWKYVALQFYPATLSCDYSFNQIAIYHDWRRMMAAMLATALVLCAWIWASWRRQAAWVLAGAIYMAGFATTANIIVPTGTIMGERLAYLPSAGFCLFVALCWSWLKDRRQTLAWGLLSALLVVLSVRTVLRNRDWKDNFALYSSAVRAAPGSAKMHASLGGQYLDRNQFDLARGQFQQALRIDQDYPDALSSYGLLELRLGNLQAAGTLMEKALNMSARNNPNYDSMSVNFAVVLARTNHSDAALDLLNREIAESPAYARAWSTRAVIRYKCGQLDGARSDAEAALRLDPTDPQATYTLSWLSAAAPGSSMR